MQGGRYTSGFKELSTMNLSTKWECSLSFAVIFPGGRGVKHNFTPPSCHFSFGLGMLKAAASLSLANRYGKIMMGFRHCLSDFKNHPLNTIILFSEKFR